MRACDNVHGGTISSDREVEGDNDPPIFDKRWDAIDQTPEQREEGKFDSHHGHPSEYKSCGDELTEFENGV